MSSKSRATSTVNDTDRVGIQVTLETVRPSYSLHGKMYMKT